MCGLDHANLLLRHLGTLRHDLHVPVFFLSLLLFHLLSLPISTFSNQPSFPQGTSTGPCILTVLEPGLGIVCACLPVMPSVFDRAVWSRISSFPILRRVCSSSSKDSDSSKSSKQSAFTNPSRNSNLEMNGLITSPAHKWNGRTMSAAQLAEDESDEQTSMV